MKAYDTPMVGEGSARRGRKSLPERIEPPAEVQRAEDDRAEEPRPVTVGLP